MKHDSYKLKARDGLSLFGQKWSAENEKALICLIHGIGEHGGRYQHMAEFMTANGFSLAALDLRGHGQSGGKRGYTPSYGSMMQDIDLFLMETVRQSAGVPCFLYGHSMGGNLVLNYCLRYNKNLTGVIATGPWLRLVFEPSKCEYLLAKLMNLVFPSFTRNNGLNAEALYHENNRSNHYTKDPLNHSFITARLFQCIHDAGLWALEHAGEFKLPLLIMHGGDDKITSAKASMDFAKAVDGCTIKIWEGLYHELHNEPQQDEVFQYVLDWASKLCK